MTRRYPAPFGPHVLCTVDTGKRKAGLAVWTVIGGEATLIGATLAEAKAAGRGRWSPRLMAGALLLARAGFLDRALLALPTIWVCERPKKYRVKRRSHKDLDALLAVIDALVKAVAPAGRVVRRNVHAWKGNVPKETHHRRVLDALRPAEAADFGRLLDPLQLGSYQDDVADAIALGLFETGRVGRGGVGR